jgi:tetratricopeptide (TPR) repeat protein
MSAEDRSKNRSKNRSKKRMSPMPEEAWRAADFAYSGALAATMLPLFGGSPSREELIDTFESILRDCPEFYPALFHLGVLHAGAGRWEEARRALFEGADRMAGREQAWPEEVDLTGGVIDPLEQGLAYDLAADLLRRLVEHYPREALLHDALGAVRVVLGRPDEAIESSRTAVELAPDNPHYVCNLGWSCLAAGRLGEAREHLERSLSLDADNRVTRGNLEVVQWLEPGGGTVEDFLLRPLDHEELARLEEAREGDAAALNRFVREHNADRLEAWKLMLCRERRPPNYPEVYKSLRAFFRFADRNDSLSAPSPALHEDLELMTARLPSLMDRLLDDMDDVDAEILDEIYTGLFSFYGFLAEKGLVEQDSLDALRSRALAETARLSEKLAGAE